MKRIQTKEANAKNTSNDWFDLGERKLFYIVAALYSSLHLGLVLLREPYFGNMDDSAFLGLADPGDPFALARAYDGFGQTLWPENGFLRPSSFLLLNYLYSAANTFGPSSLYLLNSLGVIVIVVLLTNSLFLFAEPAHSLFRPLFFLGFFVWPFSVEIIMFPSLQQKVIVLAAAGVVWALARASRGQKSYIRAIPMFGAILFAFGTKTQVVLLAPAFVYLIYVKVKARKISTPLGAALSITVTLLSMAVTLAGLRGTYTSGTRGSPDVRISELVADRRFALLCASLICLGIVHLAGSSRRVGTWLGRAGTVSDPSRVMQRFGLLIGLLYVVSFFTWNIRNYYLAVPGIFFGFLPWSLLLNASPKVKRAGVAALLFLASWVAVIRVVPIYDSFFSIREFLESEEALDIADDRALVVLYMSEATGRFRDYGRALGTPEIDFVTSQRALEICDSTKRLLVMGDQKLSPLTSAVKQGKWQLDEMVWASERESGYQVWSLRDDRVCGQ